MKPALPKLIASDLDGTFLDSHGAVSAANRAAVQRAQEAGIRVLFITGRPARWIQIVADLADHHDIIIGANGGFVADMKRREVIHRNAMESAALQSAVERISSVHPGSAYAAERSFVGMPIAPAVKTTGYNALAEQRLSHFEFAISPGYSGDNWVPPKTPVVPVSELIAQPDLTKFIVRPPDAKQWNVDSWFAEIEGLVGDVLQVTHAAQDVPQAELSARGVTKGSALEWVAESMGIAPQEVVAVGDMPNDISMLTWAGQAWAVANAHPEVHQVADHKLPHHDADAVATLIETILDR